jgi:nucleoside-diphosphate-sugar epimerase
MKVLAIGGTGFIGSPVVRCLDKQGHEVAVFHRGETEAQLPGSTRHIHGDRSNLSEFRDAFERFAPEVVVDVVPYTEAQIRQTVEVLAGLADRLVVVSSSDVYRNYDGWRGESTHPPDPVPLREDAPLREKHYPYRGYEGLDFEYADDYDKILVEKAAKTRSAPPSTILRLPAVYGPENGQHRLRAHLQRMVDERPFILLGETQAQWRWTHGYVENVAAAIALAATDEQAAGRIYNIGEREPPTEAKRVQKLAEIVGWTGEVVELPTEELPDHLQAPFNWQYELATDTSRFRDELGYSEPVSWEEALEQTVAWEQMNVSRTTEDGQFDYAAEDAAVENAL